MGYTQTAIARKIGVHKSTISRELKRNAFWHAGHIWQYKPQNAQSYYELRLKNKPKAIKLDTAVKMFIVQKVKIDWSPEQISGYAKRHNLFSISHESIYQFILKDKQKGGKLYQHLRHQNKPYRKRYGGPRRQGPIKNRISIDDRPKIVDEKARIGDWEIDTIIGKDRKQAIVSIVERKSKFTVLRKVSRKTALQVAEATISALSRLDMPVYTITADNGSEFALHETIAKQLMADFYFAHPYSSWERGLNENTNSLVRQYIKKGSLINEVHDCVLANIANKLNNRPRKLLNYKCPVEVFLNKNKPFHNYENTD